MDAFLVVKAGLTNQRRYHLAEGKSYLVGRSREADIIVKDKLASRNHCRIASSGDEWTVADLGSSNGTYVNRQRVTTHTLRDGDVLQVGGAAIEFHLAAEASSEPEVAQEPSRPAAVSPEPPAAPERAEVSERADEDELRDLLEFLDRIEKGDTPSAGAERAQRQEEPAEGDQTSQPPEAEGGLLGFLRKKKKQP